ncbi:hypothetical protein [Streptomyces sp. TP-A0874]|uniref:hypothetical protein n=1 Tax=Streptomyces sp. TP-A0874 TaxID=549819 RepID=UPI000852D19B|nr:hypothetical protein [Streptomyces sp. TP-A0874]
MAGQRGRRGGGVIVVAVSGSLLASAAVTGCSQPDVAVDQKPAADSRPADDALSQVRDAADVLLRSGSSRARTAMETAVGGTKVTTRGEGAFDYTRRIGRLRVVLPRDAAGLAEHRPVTELMTAGELYMKDRGAGVPADKWVRLDTTELVDGNLVSGGAADPLIAAELLRGVRRVSYLGETEDGSGRRLRHYRGTTDIGRAAERASEYARGALSAAVRGFAAEPVSFDAYLDGRGRLRQVRYRFVFTAGGRGPGEAGGVGAPGAGSGVEVVSTTQLFDFGAPVDTVLPAEQDIYAGEVSISGV